MQRSLHRRAFLKCSAHMNKLIASLLTHGEGELRKLICGAPNDASDVVPGSIQMYLADKALFTVHNRERRF